MAPERQNLIAFQGVQGAYSDMACRAAYPEMATLPCPSFEDTFAAVRDGRAELAMIPIENSSAGRVADIHHLLPESGLHIVGEHFERVNHALLATETATIDSLKVVRSHVQALSQCRAFIRDHGLEPVLHADTAGAAAEVATLNDPTQAAIASALAGEIYGLKALKEDIEDAEHNTTRFLIMARDPIDPDPAEGPAITSFAVAQFYADIEGHPDQRPVRLALEELSFFSREVRILGVYHAAPFRAGGGGAGGL